MKKLFLAFTIFFLMNELYAQNVGIGNINPAYPLDVAGRVRIRNSTNSAGIWYDGITLPTRSFIGTLDDNHVGIYGGGGVGWNFTMNVINGNVGIGTQAPNASAKLDISSTSTGFLMPRMTTAQRIAIISPTIGLIVFDTTTGSFWFYNGSIWALVAGNNGFTLPYNQTVALTTTAFRIFNNEFYTAIEGESADGPGVSGKSTTNIGVTGSSVDGIGVSGSSVVASGMNATSIAGYGLYAGSSNLYGIYAASGTNTAIYAQTNNANPTILSYNGNAGIALKGTSNSGTGVEGNSTSGVGVIGNSTSENGLLGTSAGTSKAGVRGEATGTGGNGVYGTTTSATGNGVAGVSTSGIGVLGTSNTNIGLKGTTVSASSSFAGVYGENTGTAGNGVYGLANFAGGYAVKGESNFGTGVFGYSGNYKGVAGSTLSGTALYGTSSSGYGLETVGNVKISGGNTNPANGAVLTSDATGNATWKKTRVGFKVSGAHVLYNQMISDYDYKLHYGQEDYDYGNNFNLLVGNGSPVSTDDIITIPVSGLYHFDTQVYLSNNDNKTILVGIISINVRRGGSIVDQIQSEGHSIRNTSKYMLLHATGDLKLQLGDQVFVSIYQQSTDASQCYIVDNSGYLYFNGSLLFED